MADRARHIVAILAGFIPTNFGTFDVPPKRAADPLPRDAARSASRGFSRRFRRRRNAVGHDARDRENEWMRRLRAAKVLVDPQHLHTRALRNSRLSGDEVDDALERLAIPLVDILFLSDAFQMVLDFGENLLLNLLAQLEQFLYPVSMRLSRGEGKLACLNC